MSLLDSFVTAGHFEDVWNDPSAWSPVFFGPGDRMPITGKMLTEEDIRYCSAVWRCANIIADSIATLPRYLYERTGPRTGKLAMDHPLFALASGSPNAEMTKFEFDQQAVINTIFYGDHYAEVLRDKRGVAREMWLLEPARMRPVRLSTGSLQFNYTTTKGGVKEFRPDQISRFRRHSLNGITGLSISQAALDAIALCKSFIEYAGKYFSNDATPPFVVLHDQPLSDAAKAKLRASLEKEHKGVANRFKFAILDAGLKAEALNVNSNRDAQLTEQMRQVIAEIARYFGVPLHKLSELTRSTNNNITQQALEFKTECIDPWITAIAQALSRDLIPRAQQGKYYIEYDVDQLIWADAVAKRESVTKLVQGCIFSPNEGRSELGYEPNPNPLANELLFPTANAPGGVVLSAPVAEPDGDEEDGSEDEPDDDDDETEEDDDVAAADIKQIKKAMEPLLVDMASRVIQRETVRICKWLNSMEQGNLKVHEFAQKVEDFYFNEHAGDIEQAFIAPVTAFASLVGDGAEKDLKQYMRDMVVRVQATGLDHVKFFIQSAGSEKELASVLRKEVFEWKSHRAPKIAKMEIEYICREMGVQDAA